MAKSDPKYVRDFKKFVDGNVTADDLPALEAEIYGSNDRSTVVMMCAIVEWALDIFVRYKLRPTLNSDDKHLLFDFVGPLGTFSAKTLVAYAFNCFGPETRHDLDLVRVLRNGFAHSRKAFGFETPQVAAVCAELKSPEWKRAFPPAGLLMRASEEELDQIEDRSHPKSRWIIGCHVLSDRLLRNAGRIKTAGFDPIPDLP